MEDVKSMVKDEKPKEMVSIRMAEHLPHLMGERILRRHLRDRPHLHLEYQ